MGDLLTRVHPTLPFGPHLYIQDRGLALDHRHYSLDSCRSPLWHDIWFGGGYPSRASWREVVKVYSYGWRKCKTHIRLSVPTIHFLGQLTGWRLSPPWLQQGQGDCATVHHHMKLLDCVIGETNQVSNDTRLWFFLKPYTLGRNESFHKLLWFVFLAGPSAWQQRFKRSKFEIKFFRSLIFIW